MQEITNATQASAVAAAAAAAPPPNVSTSTTAPVAISSPGERSSNTKAIVAAVLSTVAAVCVLLGVVALVFVALRRRKRRQANDYLAQSYKGLESHTTSQRHLTRVTDNSHSITLGSTGAGAPQRDRSHRHVRGNGTQKGWHTDGWQKGCHTDSSSSCSSQEGVAWGVPDAQRRASRPSGRAHRSRSRTKSTSNTSGGTRTSTRTRSSERNLAHKHRRSVRSRPVSASGGIEPGLLDLGRENSLGSVIVPSGPNTANSLTVMSTQNASNSTVDVRAARGDAVALAHTLDEMAAARPPGVFAGEFVILKERARGGQSIVQFARDAEAGLHQFAV